MQSLATVLGITSGFIVIGYREPALNLIATSLIVDAALAPITAVIAHRRGRSVYAWALIGLALGAWALAWAMLWNPPRQPARREPEPPTPRAA